MQQLIASTVVIIECNHLVRDDMCNPMHHIRAIFPYCNHVYVMVAQTFNLLAKLYIRTKVFLLVSKLYFYLLQVESMYARVCVSLKLRN